MNTITELTHNHYENHLIQENELVNHYKLNNFIFFTQSKQSVISNNKMWYITFIIKSGKWDKGVNSNIYTDKNFYCMQELKDFLNDEINKFVKIIVEDDEYKEFILMNKLEIELETKTTKEKVRKI